MVKYFTISLNCDTISFMSLTIDQAPAELLAPQERMTEVLHTYTYPKTNLRVEVVGPNDYRVAEAIEVEVAAMAALGDPEEEVREEFEPYRYNSLMFLAYAQDAMGTDEEILGMGRIIPSTETYGNKSLADLASIAGWTAPEVAEEVSSAEGVTHSTEEVMRAFKEEAACESMDKVWDIATLGMRLDLGIRENAMVADSLIASFAQEVITAWKEGDLTHVTSFNEVHAYQHFMKLGYPFKELFNLGPMMYDSFGSGEGMTAQPAWLSVEDLAQKIAKAQTRHMGALVTQPAMMALVQDKQ
jgi:hypothetical protein